ncbi:MAG: phosphoribosylglycinamide formyltransferase [Nevskiaceae bacterium]|jgi:phosphoribosylglycinamide formyltransferase-1|nr:phosphoribosylglycinamide formyltransferase [Nevskiaceae bacterium]
MTARARSPLKLAVLISGRGSNMVAIAQACAQQQINARIVCVISDQPDAAGLEKAREMGLPTRIVNLQDFRTPQGIDRAAFDAELARVIDEAEPDLVVLAGFMRILSPPFVRRYEGRLLNIHPSLLPAYKGLHTHQRVLDAGEREHGASVHFVTAELDGGPVVMQGRVPVLPGDDAQALAARVNEMEWKLYPSVIGRIAEGSLQWSPP